MHNTRKDKRLNKKKFLDKQLNKRNSTKDERRDKEVVDTTLAETTPTLGGKQSCLRSATENDPEWYAQEPQLLKDAYSVSFADRLGISCRWEIPDVSTTAAPYNKVVKSTIPGIYEISMIPIPGITKDGSSAVNVAAHKLFTYIRHANSGSANYQAADLMMYLLALDNCYCLWNWLVRAYGLVQVYSVSNSYLPEALLEAMGLSARDLRANACQLRTLINTFGSKLMTMKAPSHLSYFKRHAWLFSNVFMDSPTQKAQLYVYNCPALYRWVDTVSSGELPYLELEAVDSGNVSNGTIGLDKIKELVDKFMNPIFYSEDFNIMSGDILKAYGSENTLTVPIIEEGYTVVPVYNAEVLMQIENARIPIGEQSYQNDTSWRITQSAKEEIIFNPKVKISRPDIQSQYIFNFHHDDVSPEDIAVASRLNFLPNETDAQFTAGTAAGTGSLFSAGSEVVVCGRIYHMNLNRPGHPDYKAIHSHVSVNSLSGAGAALEQISQSAQFERAPLLFAYTQVVEAHGYEFSGCYGNLDNYVTISADTLGRMNDVALLSMFGIPGRL